MSPEQVPGILGVPYKILMVAASPFPYPQGSQVLTGQLAVALQQRGHRVRLAAYHCGLGPSPPGVEIHRIPAVPAVGTTPAGPSWQKPLLDLLLTHTLLQMVRQWQPDVVHTHNFEGLLVGLFTRRLVGVPVIYHVHNAMGLELHTYFRSRVGNWAGGVVGRWVDSHLARRADYCILLNEAAVDYFQRRGVTRYRVIPPGIDLKPGEAGRARHSLGGGPLVLYSGNLDRYQDLDLLLDAFRLVVKSCPDARLVFSTNAAPGECQVRAEAIGLGSQTVFLAADDFDDVRDLLSAADVAVCPRQTCLGFPIKLLNYMAAGKAIVASAGSAYGLRHLENGWVVDNGDVAGMASAIVTLLEQPALARQLGDHARSTARREHRWERAVVAMEEVYGQVAGVTDPA